MGGEAALVLGRHVRLTPVCDRAGDPKRENHMKRIRLLSLAVLPVAFAQCAPSGCTPAPPAPVGPAPTAPAAPTTTSPGPNPCNPNYDGCVPNDPIDVDCFGGNGDGPSYLQGTARVVGTDVYGLDRDDNGVACD
jgi:hypothetical protein